MGKELQTKEIIVLGRWDKAKKAIAECKDIDELKQIRDKAQALRAYAKQAQESLELQNNIAEIKLRAERKIGEFSSVLETKQGLRTDLTSPHDGKKLILKEAGIIHPERYEAISSIPKKEFENEIQVIKGLNKELTTAGIIRFAQKLQQQGKPKNTPELPKGEFDVILSDPAWKYDFSPTMYINIENHYQTMDTDDICQLKVPSAKNSVLFLWATNPKLKEALRVMEAWGFEYKTNICWDKQKPTSSKMGYWFFGQHELLLVGTKGNFSPPEKENRTPSLYSELKTKHSKKPDYFYDLIERMFPNGKYLELFARNKYNSKWKTWGNQA